MKLGSKLFDLFRNQKLSVIFKSIAENQILVSLSLPLSFFGVVRPKTLAVFTALAVVGFDMDIKYSERKGLTED